MMVQGIRLIPAFLGFGTTVIALAVAILAALSIGPDGGAVVLGVEIASTASINALDGFANVLPFGYAFGAGMVAAVNPCAFALLPAYLGIYLGATDKPANRTSRFATAMRVSATVTAGFVVLFGLAGVFVGLASAWLVTAMPVVGLVIGVILTIAGGALLAGGTMYVTLGEQMADRLGPVARLPGMVGFFAYGLAFGAASLSCALPIFLAVVGSTLVVDGAGSGIVQLVLYGLGMGFVVTLLTLAAALFRETILIKVRRVLPYVQPVSAVLLLIAGAYIVFYWLTLGGLLHA